MHIHKPGDRKSSSSSNFGNITDPAVAGIGIDRATTAEVGGGLKNEVSAFE